MRSNRWESFVGYTTFGESHGKAIGIVIEDVLPGIQFPLVKMQAALDARKPGQNEFSSSRKESDKIEIISGVFEGKTTGMPICILVYNQNMRSADYNRIKEIFRPGHADYTYFKKFKIYDYRGGGRSSGRETISRVIAGSFLEELIFPISIQIYTTQVGSFSCKYGNQKTENPFCWADEKSYSDLINYLAEIKKQGNSVGGIIEVRIKNLPAGLGDPVFEKLDANLAKAVLSIGAIKGIDFGDGFALSGFTGKESNDEMSESGFLSNHMGGILGGVSTGEPIVFRVVVKATPSISIPQDSITKNAENVTFSTKGRHDVCIIPRIIPVVKSMIQLVLADAIHHQKLIAGENPKLNDLREAIDKIDEDILIAIKRRNQISKKIGIWKKENNLPVIDNKREQKLITDLEKKATMWNMNSEIIQSIWKIILRESKKHQ